MLGVDLVAAAAAAVVMLVFGAFWYMVLFAKKWGEMFGFDKLSKKEQKEMQKQMGPLMIVQLIITVVSALALAKIIALAPEYSVLKLAVIVWAGFAAPTAISSVVFGGVEARWIKRRITIMISESFIRILLAAWVISLLQK